MKRVRIGAKREPTTALINVVFLILIFFMVAGSLSGPADPFLEFVQVEGLVGGAPPDALFIAKDGALMLDGAPLLTIRDYAALVEEGATARLAPDRNLAAQDLLRIVNSLQDGGIIHITIVTETRTP